MAQWLSGAGSVLSGISGLGNIVSGNSGKASARQYAYNLALQQQAQNWQEKMYKRRYQYQVKDLEKAGINKLYGLGTAPMMSTGMNSVGMEPDQEARNQSIGNAISALGVAADWTAKKVQNEKIKAETRTEEVNTDVKRLEGLNSALDALYKKKDLDNYEEKLKVQLERERSETTRNIAEASKAPSEIEYNLSGAYRNRTDAKLNNTTSRKLEQDMKQSNEVTAGMREQSKAEADFLKKHPKLKKAIGGAKALSGIFGGIATAGGLGIGGVATYNGIKNKTARKNKK